MSKRGHAQGTAHSILVGVMSYSAPLHGEYATAVHKLKSNPINIQAIRTGCAHGRAKPITLPTCPFNYKDDEA